MSKLDKIIELVEDEYGSGAAMQVFELLGNRKTKRQESQRKQMNRSFDSFRKYIDLINQQLPTGEQAAKNLNINYKTLNERS